MCACFHVHVYHWSLHMYCEHVRVGTLAQYNAWLEGATVHPDKSGQLGRPFPVKEIFGFFMGFRKDHNAANYHSNTLLYGGKNEYQGSWVNTRPCCVAWSCKWHAPEQQQSPRALC